MLGYHRSEFKYIDYALVIRSNFLIGGKSIFHK